MQTNIDAVGAHAEKIKKFFYFVKGLPQIDDIKKAYDKGDAYLK